MKKILMFTVIMLLVLGTSAFAHPPQKLEADFNMETHMLNVEFVHTVGGENSNHYVDKISVMVNETEVITQIPGKQLNNNETFIYYMPGLSKGDQVQIMAYCSVSGDRSTKITIGE